MLVGTYVQAVQLRCSDILVEFWLAAKRPERCLQPLTSVGPGCGSIVTLHTHTRLCWVGRFRRLLGLCWVGLAAFAVFFLDVFVDFVASASSSWTALPWPPSSSSSWTSSWASLRWPSSSSSWTSSWTSLCWPLSSSTWTSSWTSLRWPSSSSTWTSSWTCCVGLRRLLPGLRHLRRLRRLLPGPRTLIWV